MGVLLLMGVLLIRGFVQAKMAYDQPIQLQAAINERVLLIRGATNDKFDCIGCLFMLAIK